MSSIQQRRVKLIKVARSLQQGKDIFGRNKKIRSNLPGKANNAQAPRKISAYGEYIRNIRIVKNYYNIRTKIIDKYVEAAINKPGNTEDNLISLLELRLGSLVLRSGWASTALAASQLVSHKHIKVNGKSVNIRSYQCCVNDTIELDNDYYNGNSHLKASVELHRLKKDQPDWITVSNNKITIVKKPDLATVDYPVELKIDQIIQNHRR